MLKVARRICTVVGEVRFCGWMAERGRARRELGRGGRESLFLCEFTFVIARVLKNVQCHHDDVSNLRGF